MERPKSSPRILLVVPYTVPDFAGSGINAFYFARFLNREGTDASVLTFNRNLSRKRREIIEGVPVRRISYFNRNLLTKILSLSIILPGYLAQLLRHDLIILYGAHIIGYQFLIPAGRLLGKILVFRSLLLGADDLRTLTQGRPRLRKYCSRLLFRKIDLYFAIHPVFATLYREYTGCDEKVMICPQGVDVSYFKPASKEKALDLREGNGIPEDCFVILSVGFLVNRKGFPESFRSIRGLDFEFRYYVVGEYDFQGDHFMSGYRAEAQEIRRQGTEMLGERLCLAGPVKDLRNYYHMADLVLINSASEGLPNTLMEAMACGKTVLIRDLPGISYLVSHMKTAVLFADGEEMANQIIALREKPALRLEIGRNAARHIRSFASFEKTYGALAGRLNLT